MMPQPDFVRCATLALGALLSVPAASAQKAEVKGSLVLGGVDAHLAHVRAAKVVLDAKEGTGYEVVLSERPAAGALASWKTADPRERGNFLHLVFTAKGEVWVYEIGHAGAKNRPFGGVMEIQKVAFAVRGNQLTAQVRTLGEQSFSDDRFTLDLTFEATLEGK
jgi:hypothetical protein